MRLLSWIQTWRWGGNSGQRSAVFTSKSKNREAQVERICTTGSEVKYRISNTRVCSGQRSICQGMDKLMASAEYLSTGKHDGQVSRLQFKKKSDACYVIQPSSPRAYHITVNLVLGREVGVPALM